MATAAKKLAVITGASSGIGYELAREFIEHGYDLIIAAEDEGIESAAQSLERTGMRVEPFEVDLSTYEGVEELYAKIGGRAVDAIAINAGVGVSGEFQQTSLEEELNMINLNVVSTVHLAKRIAPDMVARGSGRILFTASIASVMPAPFMAVYGATKAFVLSFSDALRSELEATGVTVTALMPGPTDTNFFERAHALDTKVGADDKDDPAQVARQGFEALMKGKDHVLGGSIKSRTMGAMAEIMPEAMKARQHRKMAEPGSASKAH
jgi:short-subunit dehydrogenase